VAGAGLSVEALRRSLAQRFEPVTWPRRYRLVSELPRSETGKVRRADLLRLFAQAESAPEPELVLVDTAGLDA
jgi:acyl-coenzyme A synthetase/AMP-(fatty) acid ligase